MAALVDCDGFVNLSPSRLALFECPRRARWYMERPDGPGSPASAIGLAAHAVLARLARDGWCWPPNGGLEGLVDGYLHREWAKARLPEDGYAGYLGDLVALLEGLPRFWRPPADGKGRPEQWSQLQDRPSRIRLRGRLDLLLPPSREGGAIVTDYKTGAVSEREEPGLAAIAQAILARAYLRFACPVRVDLVYLREALVQTWALDQRTIAEGWGRLTELAADVFADRWPTVPGDICGRCPVAECEHYLVVPDAAALGLQVSQAESVPYPAEGA